VLEELAMGTQTEISKMAYDGGTLKLEHGNVVCSFQK